MLGYPELAVRLGIPQGTLFRRLKQFNQLAGPQGQIVPAIAEEVRGKRGKAVRHLFHVEQVGAIKQALASLPHQRRGRPRKGGNNA